MARGPFCRGAGIGHKNQTRRELRFIDKSSELGHLDVFEVRLTLAFTATRKHSDRHDTKQDAND